MKKITLLFLLFFSILAFGQNKIDFRQKTNYAISFAKDAVTFAKYKLKALDSDDNKVIKLSDEQRKTMEKLFLEQYPVFKSSVETYKESKTAQSKIDLIRVLLKIEDDFRKLLTEEQNIHYKSYDPKEKFLENSDFIYFFMTEQQYNAYKKELL